VYRQFKKKSLVFFDNHVARDSVVFLLRKDLSAGALACQIRRSFHLRRRRHGTQISMTGIMMSSYAVFSFTSLYGFLKKPTNLKNLS